MSTASELQAIRDDLADLRRTVESLTTERRSSPPTPTTPDTLTEEHLPLYEALVDWRREEAARQSVPAYRVLSNAILADITVARPADRFEFSRVKGVGPDKTERYADAVLAIVEQNQPW